MILFQKQKCWIALGTLYCAGVRSVNASTAVKQDSAAIGTYRVRSPNPGTTFKDDVKSAQAIDAGRAEKFRD